MNDNYEAEIDLKDLFFYVLCKWRAILLGAAVFGVLLGGYKYLLNTLESGGESGKPKEIRLYEIELEQYKLTQSAYEQNIEDYRLRLHMQETYMEKSVLMKTDPDLKPTASADFFVKLDGAEWQELPDNPVMDPTDSVIGIYTTDFVSNLDWEPIEALTGMEAVYLKELLSISADYNNNHFTIGVIYSDGDTAQQILDIIIEQITAKSNDIKENVNKHSLALMNKTLTYSIDASLADAQKANADALSEYQQAILAEQQNLEDLEGKKPQYPNSVKKFVYLGLAAGAFLMVLFYGAIYILGGKLCSEMELNARYGCRLLGTVPHFGEVTRSSRIDRFLNRLRGSVASISKEETCRLIALKIREQSGPKEKVLITGTIDPKKIQAFAEAVALNSEDIILETAPNVNLSADALSRLVECDAVILAEELHRSMTADIEKEYKEITTLKKTVLGYVLL